MTMTSRGVQGAKERMSSKNQIAKGLTKKDTKFKCGYVAVLGLSNAGKSSLVNALVGEDVSIVSHRHQTTRVSVLGIKNGEEFQIIFMDTPGIHHSKNSLDKFMSKNVRSALAAADVVLYLFDGTKPMEQEEKEYIKMLQGKTDKLILLQTKSDKKQIDFEFDATKISVIDGTNLSKLEKEIVALLPEQPPIFDEELYTTQTLRFLVAEKIRQVLLEKLDEEIPHGIAVEIENFSEEQNCTNIEASIICEREQHKGIIIGKGGKMIKEIGAQARKSIEQLTGQNCNLKLFVKVDKDWRNRNSQNYYS